MALAALLLLLPGTMPVRAAAPAAPSPAAKPAPAHVPNPMDGIAAVVNGMVISHDDVVNRERLFAISAGLHPDPQLLERLAPQVTRALIDEKLQLQEMQRRKVVVPDADIAQALAAIESRNNMRPGALRAGLESQGVSLRTLIDQIRVQLGWTRVLREVLGPRAEISDAEIADRIAQIKAQTGRTEYRVAEIFVPVDQPAQAPEAQRFADTIITQLRAGASFGVLAAEFSAAQSALQGGDMGWVTADRLDPAVAALVAQMPEGAVSNPVRVPGGFVIVTLRAKREIGRDMATVATVRQAFFPFDAPLDPQHPTAQQTQTLAKAQALSREAKSCADIEAAAQAVHSPRPADPGELRVEAISSAPMRQLLSSLPPGKTSSPLVAPDGILVVMVCSKETRNVAEPTREEVTSQILQERAEQAARQLLSDLRRRAIIERRGA